MQGRGLNMLNIHNLTDEQYGLLFDVRRSIRYHDRRRCFYETCHRITNLLTILMAGSVLFELGRSGPTAWWLVAISAVAALFAAVDMVIGYHKCAALHRQLREKFANLEIEMLSGKLDEATWNNYQTTRLMIEKDEPGIYNALDALCRNELLRSEGFSKQTSPNEFVKVGFWQSLTSDIYRWPNLGRG
jgi:hypothetical protein